MKVTKAKALERQPFDPDASARKDHDFWEGMQRLSSPRCWSGGLNSIQMQSGFSTLGGLIRSIAPSQKPGALSCRSVEIKWAGVQAPS
jgi:hypothetical protein